MGRTNTAEDAYANPSWKVGDALTDFDSFPVPVMEPLRRLAAGRGVRHDKASCQSACLTRHHRVTFQKTTICMQPGSVPRCWWSNTGAVIPRRRALLRFVILLTPHAPASLVQTRGAELLDQAPDRRASLVGLTAVLPLSVLEPGMTYLACRVQIWPKPSPHSHERHIR